MKSLTSLLFLAALALPAFAAAQPKVTPTPPQAKIESMAWMKGYWAGEGYGGTVETMMSPPKAGTMIGWFRHMKADGKPGFYEICAIEEFEGTLRFVVKHFHPSWVGWEEKDRALQARLVRHSNDEWQFSNMLIKRAGRDAFVIEMTITPREGPARKEILRFRRQAP